MKQQFCRLNKASPSTRKLTQAALADVLSLRMGPRKPKAPSEQQSQTFSSKVTLLETLAANFATVGCSSEIAGHSELRKQILQLCLHPKVDAKELMSAIRFVVEQPTAERSESSRVASVATVGERGVLLKAISAIAERSPSSTPTALRELAVDLALPPQNHRHEALHLYRAVLLQENEDVAMKLLSEAYPLSQNIHGDSDVHFLRLRAVSHVFRLLCEAKKLTQAHRMFVTHFYPYSACNVSSASDDSKLMIAQQVAMMEMQYTNKIRFDGEIVPHAMPCQSREGAERQHTCVPADVALCFNPASPIECGEMLFRLVYHHDDQFPSTSGGTLRPPTAVEFAHFLRHFELNVKPGEINSVAKLIERFQECRHHGQIPGPRVVCRVAAVYIQYLLAIGGASQKDIANYVRCRNEGAGKSIEADPVRNEIVTFLKDCSQNSFLQSDCAAILVWYGIQLQNEVAVNQGLMFMEKQHGDWSSEEGTLKLEGISLLRSRIVCLSITAQQLLEVCRKHKLWTVPPAGLNIPSVGETSTTLLKHVIHACLTHLDWQDTIQLLQAEALRDDYPLKKLVVTQLVGSPRSCPPDATQQIKALLAADADKTNASQKQSGELNAALNLIEETSWEKAMLLLENIDDNVLRNVATRKVFELSISTGALSSSFTLPLLRSMTRDVLNENIAKSVLSSALIAGDVAGGFECHETIRKISPRVCTLQSVADTVEQLREKLMQQTSVANVAGVLALKINQSNWKHAVMLFERYEQHESYTRHVAELTHIVNAVKYSYLGLGKWKEALTALRQNHSIQDLPLQHRRLFHECVHGQQAALNSSQPPANKTRNEAETALQLSKIKLLEMKRRNKRKHSEITVIRRNNQSKTFFRVSEAQRGQVDAVMLHHRRNGNWEEAITVLQELRNRRIDYRDLSMQHIIGACRNAKRWEEGIAVYSSMVKHRVHPEPRVSIAALKIANDANQWVVSLAILNHTVERSKNPNPHVAALAIQGLIGAGVSGVAFEGAKLVLHIRHPALSDAVLDAMMHSARWNDAVQYFHDMLHQGVKPSDDSVDKVLVACKKARQQCNGLTEVRGEVTTLLEDILSLSTVLLEHVVWVQKSSGFQLNASIVELAAKK